MRLQMIAAVTVFDLLVIAGLFWLMRQGMPPLLIAVPGFLLLSFSGLALIFALRRPR